ncbi:hypothetical protein [Sinomonas humi]|uniref:Uncharacterized protein n=1 Tax=Sinomonas humi TaxID=1338436 RepID=A0A0B2AP85_9MICC|nr:hypothetical protein [Sinomonas humi]KHL03799.1 hypothetical protein LK10_08400 [Sinomonas humi]
MAKAHNSKLVEARRKARELATAQQERHEKLIGLAESYFVANGEAEGFFADATEAAEKLMEDAMAKGRALVAEAKAKAAGKEKDARQFIAQMVATGASVADVASRLDVKVAVVRAAVKEAAEAAHSEHQEAGSTAEAGGNADDTEGHDGEQHDGHAA